MRPDTWVRATNAGCGWLRFVLLPLTLVPLWFGDMMLSMMVMMAWMMVPLAFRKPTSDDAWMTRAAMGIQIWRSHPFDHPALLLAFLGTVVGLVLGAAAAWRGVLWLAAGGGVLFVGMQLVMHLWASRLFASRRERS